MDTFHCVVRYKEDGRVLDFIVLTQWELLLEEICAYWPLEAPPVRVKYVIPNERKMMSYITSKGNF